MNGTALHVSIASFVALRVFKTLFASLMSNHFSWKFDVWQWGASTNSLISSPSTSTIVPAISSSLPRPPPRSLLSPLLIPQPLPLLPPLKKEIASWRLYGVRERWVACAWFQLLHSPARFIAPFEHFSMEDRWSLRWNGCGIGKSEYTLRMLPWYRWHAYCENMTDGLQWEQLAASPTATPQYSVAGV